MPEPESIVLRCLRSINTKMGGSARDIGDVRIRLSSLETGMTGVEAAVVHVRERLDGVQAQLDNATKRLDRIERRLDLTSTPSLCRCTRAGPVAPRIPPWRWVSAYPCLPRCQLALCHDVGWGAPAAHGEVSNEQRRHPVAVLGIVRLWLFGMLGG